MDNALSNRQLILREVAPASFLDSYIPELEWAVEIDDKIQIVTVNGDPSDEVQWNSTLRTLVWTNFSGEGSNLISGALSFDRTFTACHGRVTSGEGLSYLVASSSQEQSDGPAPAYELINKELQAMMRLNILDPPPAYSGLNGDEPPLIGETHSSESVTNADGVNSIADSKVEPALEVEFSYSEVTQAPAPILAEPTPPQQTTIVKVVNYLTQTSKLGKNKFTPSHLLGFASEKLPMSVSVILFDNEDITQFVTIMPGGNQFKKDPAKGKDVCPYGFDITFTGDLTLRQFTGTLVDEDGVEVDWKGQNPFISDLARTGTPQEVKGSDGLSIDPLLLTISPVKRDGTQIDPVTKEPITIDLAQKEADRVFGRLLFASVDKKIGDFLFPGMFTLTPAEKEIQNLGEEFLRTAGVHAVMGHLKESEKVKSSTKAKIKKVKCDQFIPMCLATGAQSSDPTTDPVLLYGWNRETDKEKVAKLQGQATEVTRACYLHGYRTAVTAIVPYLNNAGEWYGRLSEAMTSDVWLADWTSKAEGSGGFAKTLYDLTTKLELLWDAAHANPELLKRLPPNAEKPMNIVATVNARTLCAALDTFRFDDTARDNVKEMFRKLDEMEKDKRNEQLVAEFRKQMIVDHAIPVSFQSMCEYALKMMDEMREKAGMSIGPDVPIGHQDVDHTLAIIEDNHAIAPPAEAPSWYKTMKSTTGFWSYFRAFVTMVGVGGLIYLFSKGSSKMDLDEQLAMVGSIAHGLMSVSVMVKALGSSAAGQLMSYAQLLYKKILAPIGMIAKRIGLWLYNSLGNVGKGLIQGIGRMLAEIAALVQTGVEKVTGAVARAGTWLKSLPIRWGEIFKAVANVVSFGLSALCFWIAVKDCIKAWKNGRTVDKVTSTIAAALAGLEVLCLVIQGIAFFMGKSGIALASACSAVAPILAAAGIVFAVVLIFLAFYLQEDPLDDLVEEFGNKYGIRE